MSSDKFRVLVAARDRVQQEFRSCLNSMLLGAIHLEHFDNLRDCINRLHKGTAQLLVIDAELVGTDVRPLSARVQQFNPHLPILYIGAVADCQIPQLMAAGLTDVISEEELSARYLSRLIGRIKQGQNLKHELLARLSDCVIHSNFDGIVLFDTRCRVQIWNHGMEQIFGLSKKDALHQLADDVIPNFRASGEERLVIEAFNNRPALGREQLCEIPTTGRRICYRAFYSPICDRQGKVMGVMAIVRDLTEKKITQAAMYAADANLSRLADLNPNLVWISDSTGRRNYFNERWQKFTGRSLEELKSDGWLQNVHPSYVPKVKAALEKAMANHQPFHIEYRLKGADGRYHNMLESGTPQEAPDSSFVGYLGICTDVGETRMTYSNIPVPLQERLHTTTGTGDHSPIGMWKLGPDLIVQKANDAVSDLLGVKRELLLGKHFPDIVTSVTPEVLQEILEKGTRLRIQNQQITLRTSRNPRIVFWDLDAWPVTDENDTIIGIGLSTTEVTERKKAEQQKEDLVATLVHDLKTPLIGADRTLQAILDGSMGGMDDDQSKILRVLKNNNRQLLSMVQNLIEVYKVESGSPRFAFESLDLADLLTRTVEELSVLAKERSVYLTQDFPADLGHVIGDRLAIRRVFQNLIDNAIKFTQASGIIRVTAEQNATYITVNITDSGAGISEADQEHLFKRFARGQSGRRSASGAGLGLYLCKQIIDAHEGQLTFRSKVNEGTTFSVRFNAAGKGATSAPTMNPVANSI